MKAWLEQGVGLIMIGAAAGIGLLVRMVLFGYYGRLYKECKRFEKSRHKAVAYIKQELKQRVEKRQEIKNAVTYTECRLAECKMLGVRIGWLENIMLYSTLFVLLCGIMAAFAGVLSGCEERTVLCMLFVSGVTVLGLLATDMILGLRDKYRRIRLMIRDYIENSWSVRAEWSEDNLLPEELTERTAEKDKKHLQVPEKKNVSKDKPVKVKNRKKGKAQEEKRRLTEELLRERRQLEARSFAEQRKREQDVQVTVEQVQEEAAAAVTQCEEPVAIVSCENTENNESKREEEKIVCRRAEEERKGTEDSYELLMREVLAEYLA